MSAVFDQAATYKIYAEPAAYPQAPETPPPWKVEPPPLQVGGPAPVPPPVHIGGGTYVVRPGDNLYDIAKHLYRNPNLYPVIQAANPQVGPDGIIYAGQRLRIPSLPEPPPGSVAVIVQPGDSVWGFAGGNPTLIQRIAKLNHINPAVIYAGQALIIPPAA